MLPTWISFNIVNHALDLLLQLQFPVECSSLVNQRNSYYTSIEFIIMLKRN